MTDGQRKIIIGGLLHDIGKVLYRAGTSRQKHSKSGYEFLKDELQNENIDKDILEQVLYHHGDALKEAEKNARVADNSLAYITYIADNIASAADRRTINEGDETKKGFDEKVPLEAVFSILNGERASAYYTEKILKEELGRNIKTSDERGRKLPGNVNYPGQKVSYTKEFYKKVESQMWIVLKHLKCESSDIDILLDVLENFLTYIPSSTAEKERPDISLYDHVKLTAAIGSCIYDYLKEDGEQNYKQRLFGGRERKFYDEKAFLLCSVDISGIQAFIYNIQNEDALKNLRARSFYLEIFLENVLDEIFATQGVSRANLIYSGGGHAYFLLPNTRKARKDLEDMEQNIGQWLLRYFKTDLYMGFGAVECSANELENKPEGSYKELFSKIVDMINEKKNHRYSAKQILFLNNAIKTEQERECRICHRSDRLVKKKINQTATNEKEKEKEGDLCEMCRGFLTLGREIAKDDLVFTIVRERREDKTQKGCEGDKFDEQKKLQEKDKGMPVFPGMYLVTETNEALNERIEEDASYVRAYSKNKIYHIEDYTPTTKLWVGDYKSHDTLKELVEGATGVNRLAVLRADIDNLGKAFVQGFESEKNGGKYNTLSRTATFSRKISLFFKMHINTILAGGQYSLDDLSGIKGEEKNTSGNRRAAIVYSGGDDVFIVGAWKDILEFAIDLYRDFGKYTQQSLTLSAGIGLYHPNYPIFYMAQKTGDLEEASKRRKDEKTGESKKNAITIFEQEGENGQGHTYEWDVFINEVLGEKFAIISQFFAHSQDRGKSFLYRLLELFRERDEEKINLARLAYMLSRLENDIKHKNEKRKNRYEQVEQEKQAGQEETEREKGRQENRKEIEEQEAKKAQYREFSRKIYEWRKRPEDRRQVITAIYIYAYLIRDEA